MTNESNAANVPPPCGGHEYYREGEGKERKLLCVECRQPPFCQHCYCSFDETYRTKHMTEAIEHRVCCHCGRRDATEASRQ